MKGRKERRTRKKEGANVLLEYVIKARGRMKGTGLACGHVQ
jgi:hypothetical protein